MAVVWLPPDYGDAIACVCADGTLSLWEEIAEGKFFRVLSYSMFLTILHFHDGNSCAVIIFCTEKSEGAYALMR